MAPSRGFCGVVSRYDTRNILCFSQARCFRFYAARESGHNRWSKIKHDKGKNDAAKNRQRSIFAQEIATASKLFGPEPGANPRLADLITKAKREGFAKTSIEAAIARGQGRSLSGASLESITIEGMLPNNVAVIVDCETDNKLRTLAEVRLVIKLHGGIATPTSYLFSRKGRLTFESNTEFGADDILEPALDAGATDVVEDEDGRIVVFTEPGETRVVGDAICSALGVEIATSKIIWDPISDTAVGVPSDSAATDIEKFIDELQDKETTVHSVAMNISQGTLAEDVWKDLQNRILP